MSDNRDYWKELLGEAYSDDLFDHDAPVGDIGQTGADGRPFFPKELDASSDEEISAPDADQFITFDITPKRRFEEPSGPSADLGEVIPEDGEEPAPSDDDDDDKTDVGPDDFEVDFDFDEEYRSTEVESSSGGGDGGGKPLHTRRQRRSGCVGGILYALFILCISIIVSSLLWLAASDALALGKRSSEVTVILPEDIFSEAEVEVKDEDGNVTGTETVLRADIDELADILKDAGLIKYKPVFKLYAKFSHAADEVEPGDYTLNTEYDYMALVRGMQHYESSGIVTVSIPEGYNIMDIFRVLEEKGVCSQEKLWEAATNYDFEYDFLDSETLGDRLRLEGYLFPDTYDFYEDTDPETAISKFLDNFEVKFTDEFAQQAEDMGYSVREVLTIASMIEREAAYDAERDKIASTIYNRLNSDSFSELQIDATIYYGIALNGGSDDDFSTSYDSPYNTYLIEGLPPGPICNPGVSSIRGALYPQDTDYYYYALSVDGGHVFFTNYSDFASFVESDQYGG